MNTKNMVFFVTTPDYETSEKIATNLVENKLAACVNIFPNVTSIYRWKSKIETDKEFFMIIKSTSELRSKLFEYIQNHHPYDNPECIGFAVGSGLPQYLQWIIDSVK